MRRQPDPMTSQTFLQSLDIASHHFGVYRCSTAASATTNNTAYTIEYVERGLGSSPPLSLSLDREEVIGFGVNKYPLNNAFQYDNITTLVISFSKYIIVAGYKNNNVNAIY